MKIPKHKITLHLSSTISQMGEQIRFDQDEKGEMYQTEKEMVLNYTETLQKSTSNVTLTLLPDSQMQLKKQGATDMRLSFSTQNPEQTSEIYTAHGTLYVNCHTKEINVQQEKTHGKIRLSYELYVAEELLGNYCLELSWQVTEE